MSPIKFSSILKFSIDISSGQIDRIINGNKDIFHAEPELIEKLQNNDEPGVGPPAIDNFFFFIQPHLVLKIVRTVIIQAFIGSVHP